MRDGQSAPVPAKFCNDSTPSELNPSELEVVFLEEGDSAALFYQNKIIAAIPAWGITSDGTLGYSAELSSQFMDTKPLSEMPKELLDRILAARKFWENWQLPGTEVQYFETYYSALQNTFGEHAYHAPIETEKWPPKIVYIFEKPEATIFATVGTSILAQPCLEPYNATSQALRRFEVAMALSPEIMNEVPLEYIVSLLRDIAFAPWLQMMWFGANQALLYPLKLPENQSGKPYVALLFTKAELGAPKPKFPAYRGDEINFLWAIPITESEFNYHASLNNAKAGTPSLIEHMQEKKISWIHTSRESVVAK